MDRILNMILRQLTRRLVNKGINMGINKAASMGRGKGSKSDVAEGQASPEQRQQGKRAAHQTRRAAKMMGRITRL